MGKSKRFNSKLYTFTKVKYDSSKKGLYYQQNDDGTLFADLKYRTKIKESDLPAWYVKGRYYKNHGFLSAKDVKYMVYAPNYLFNHFHKDDMLYISYNTPILAETSEEFGHKTVDYTGYDYVISGSEIVYFVAAAKKYSNYDTREIEDELIKKSEWFLTTFPDDAEAVSGKNHIENLLKIFGRV
jgi:hypothetical protein